MTVLVLRVMVSAGWYNTGGRLAETILVLRPERNTVVRERASLRLECRGQRCSAGPMKSTWCPGAESNHRHCDFQSHALPTELPGPIAGRVGAACLPHT
jgi:hypothetical protein